MIEPLPTTADLGVITAAFMRLLLRSIAPNMDDATLKDCVMLARSDGHLTDAETEFYIAAWGLREA